MLPKNPHSYAENDTIRLHNRTPWRCVNSPRHDQTDWNRLMPQSITIPANQGKIITIDAEDWPLVSQYHWSVGVAPGSSRFYATTAWYVFDERGNKRRTSVGIHRLILSAPDGVMVDHINGDGLDNRRSNLRLASNSLNQANRRILPKNTSGFRGVTRRGISWEASIKYQGNVLYLGRYRHVQQAALAYDSAAAKLFGEFANLNFPDMAAGVATEAGGGA